jgi:hypothetical protein
MDDGVVHEFPKVTECHKSPESEVKAHLGVALQRPEGEPVTPVYTKVLGQVIPYTDADGSKAGSYIQVQVLPVEEVPEKSNVYRVLRGMLEGVYKEETTSEFEFETETPVLRFPFSYDHVEFTLEFDVVVAPRQMGLKPRKVRTSLVISGYDNRVQVQSRSVYHQTLLLLDRGD